MAAAQPSAFSTKLKLHDPLPSMLEGNKFLKWTDANSGSEKFNSNLPVGVILKTDPKCFILYWRDLNKKSDYLDISCIRDVRTGKYASIPKDKYSRDILMSGKSNASIQEKTISIYYGPDFIDLQIINFVSMSENAVEIAKTWTDFLFKCSINQRMQNLSPWENLIKLRSCLLYGKSVIDDKKREFKLPVQTLIDSFISNGRIIESERQHIAHALQSVGLPSGKNDILDEKTLTIEKFFQLFIHLVSKEDIEQIFLSYPSNDASKRKLYLTPEQFENFLNKEQRDPGLNELLYPFCTTDKSAEMIQKYETDESFRKKKQLSPQGLMRFLMDFENEIIDPVKYELCDDMEQPISHYFINSSHNTYLTGHQITGKSDAEMYRQVLLSGCRCIELDCHEDDSQDEPVITHGRTLCTKILFSEAIHAINETAFKTSPYPVLLSFENFCGKRMQEKMVKYLKDILGEQLLIEPLQNYPLKPGVQLPSPEDLKYKILVKFRKKRSERINSNSSNNFKNESLSNITDNASNIVRLTSVVQNLSEFDGNSTISSTIINSIGSNQHLIVNNYLNDPLKFNSKQENTQKFTRIDSQQTNTDSSDSDREESYYSKRPNLKISTSASTMSNFDGSNPYNREMSFNLEMAQLVNYIQPTTFRSFEISQRKNRSYEMSSFVETTAFNLHKDKPTEFVNYNKRQLSRIYPKGTRISSDNFIPQIFWNVGCQLVALNFQTFDIGMRLNQGKFEYNNRSGYLLKPEIMRRTDVNKLFDPFTESPLDGIVATTLKIRIISGIFLNCGRNDDKKLGYSASIELYGLPADSVRGQKSHRVKCCSSNTFNVIYSDPVGFTFKKIIMPQLAMIKVSAFDDQNKLIGFRVLPVVGLRPGYRYICLKNECNQPLLMSTLFVHIQMHDYVPEEYEDFATALVNPISYVTSLSKKEEMLKTLTDDNEAIASLYDLYDPEDVNDRNDLSNYSNVQLSPAIKNKRNSYVSPKSIQKFLNGSNNCLDKIQMHEKGSNSNLNLSSNNLNLNLGQNQNLINRLKVINRPRENRFSLSVEKFSQNLLTKANYGNLLDPKQTSQSDLVNIKSGGLSNSMYNMHRSNSLFSYELDCMDIKKFKINSSQLNDPNLFLEIDLEALKTNKSYIQLAKSFSKKIDKIEKETHKKVSELDQNLSFDLNKLKCNYEKEKLKLDKWRKKNEEKKNIKKSKTSIDLGSLFRKNSESVNNTINFSTIESFSSKLTKTREKYYDQILNLYEEHYKNLYSRLEKLVHEIYESRMQQLKVISEKEFSIVNKQAHQNIKSKRKILAETIQDKEELQRLIKKIEKESVTQAVNENSKLEDLLKVKQKLIKQIVDNCLSKLKEFKEKQSITYNNEFVQKLNEKKYELKIKYLPSNSLKTDINNNIHLSSSTSQLDAFSKLKTNLNNNSKSQEINPKSLNENLGYENETTRL